MLFGFLMLVTVDIVQLISPRIAQRAIDYIITTYATFGNNYSYLGKFTFLIFALVIAIGIFRFFWRNMKDERSLSYFRKYRGHAREYLISIAGTPYV